MRLVRPNTEELISWPFLGENRFIPIVVPEAYEHRTACIRPHAPFVLPQKAFPSSICSEASLMDLFAEKSTRPASQQILLKMPFYLSITCVFKGQPDFILVSDCVFYSE